MQHGLANIFTALRLLALACACAALPAQADDYADVSQLLSSGKLAEAAIKADNYLAAKPRDPQMRFLKGVIERSAGKVMMPEGYRPSEDSLKRSETKSLGEIRSDFLKTRVPSRGMRDFDKGLKDGDIPVFGMKSFLQEL